MSLDVYLSMPGMKRQVGSKIFIRMDGQTKEISHKEWYEKFPGRDPFVTPELETDDLFSANITHNLGRMAGKAEIYDVLWRPNEIGITKAKQLIEPLTIGLATLKSDPEHFRTFNAANGWGKYENLIAFVEEYLNAATEYPDADVRVSR